jgi:predicted N-acetyltransferase YhbS
MSRIPEQRDRSARATVCVRSAGRRDHDEIRRVIREAYGQYEPLLPGPVFDRYLADLLDLELHAANGELVVAEHGQHIVGQVAFYPDTALLGFTFPPGWASGRGLAVHPAARGLGVARALIAHSERRARSNHSPVFAFHTAGFMGTAIELYDGLEYQRAPEYDVDLALHYGFDGFDPIPVIAYRRDLLATPAFPRPSRLTRRSQ